MKKRMFTIGIIAAVAMVVILFTFSQGFFSTAANAIETYTAYEKDLSKLFVKYSDTMTDEELAAWQDEVDQAAANAANALIRIQEDPDDWREYLASTGQPYRPSPFAPLEFTGFAAKSPKEVTSDEFDAWLEARYEQTDDHTRAEMIAEGVWEDEQIERIIANIKENRLNDPERQANREKWRQLIIEKEGRPARERERAARERQVAEYQARRAKDKTWRAAEQEKIDKMRSEASEMPTEAGGTPEGDFNTLPEGEVNTFESMPPLEFPTAADDDADAQEGIETSQPPPFVQEPPSVLPQEDPFNPDAFALTFSEDMSHWDDVLQESYEDVFELDASFEERLPAEARPILNERRQRLQSEYVRRIDAVLRDVPKENRSETLRVVRDRLSETWGSDFTDAVIEALERTDE